MNLVYKPASLRTPSRPKTPTDSSRTLGNINKILPGLQFLLLVFLFIFYEEVYHIEKRQLIIIKMN
jgi:hypothetical protein